MKTQAERYAAHLAKHGPSWVHPPRLLRAWAGADKWKQLFAEQLIERARAFREEARAEEAANGNY